MLVRVSVLTLMKGCLHSFHISIIDCKSLFLFVRKRLKLDNSNLSRKCEHRILTSEGPHGSANFQYWLILNEL